MRAVNNVIMAAGILKKNHPDMQEDLQARYLVITPTIATPTCRRTCRHVT